MVALVVVALFSNQVNPTQTAVEALENLHLAEADASAANAIRTGSLDPTQYAQMLEVRAITALLRKRPSEAKDLFIMLLALVPGYSLPQRYGPKARTLYVEAKYQGEKAQVDVEAVPSKPGELVLKLRDPFKYVVDVEVLASLGSAEVSDRRPASEVDGAGILRFSVPKEVHAWRVVLRDRYGNGIARFPTDETRWPLEQPGRDDLSLERAVSAPPEAAAVTQRPTLPETASQSQPMPGVRVAAIALASAAIVALAVAIGFGVNSLEPSRIRDGFRLDDDGRVTNITQRDAFQAAAQAAQSALIANILFGVAGLLGISGVTSFIVSL
jgi:hypothetical protein